MFGIGKKQSARPKEEPREFPIDLSYCEECGRELRTCRNCFRQFCPNLEHSDWHIREISETRAEWTCHLQ